MRMPESPYVSLLNWACINAPENVVLEYLQCDGATTVLDLKDRTSEATALALALGKNYAKAAAKMIELGADPRDVIPVIPTFSAK